MRQFLVMAFLNVTLAAGASPALAFGDKVDYLPSYQPAPTVSAVSQNVIRTESRESVVAGGSSAATSVYRHLREENFGH